ncbi:MAG: DNA mismatch repair protein MutS [Oscillospiraceae bacterium]|nr:DNA mismatch repair protein MutS [Oscillospiraceae bacterium]
MVDSRPMMRQYYELKEQTENCILFFRLGDFYEMFDDDARLVSSELDIALTSRDRKKPPEEQVPMCGVPYHSAESYIARLIAKGYRVAICEQTEDPKKAKGLVKREVVRIVTPGTAMEDTMLDSGRNNYLCSICVSNTGWAICSSDISTGQTRIAEGEGDDISRLLQELSSCSPKEVLLDEGASLCSELCEFISSKLSCICLTSEFGRFEYESAKERTVSRFSGQSALEEMGERAYCACGALLSYLYDTQKTELGHLRELDYHSEGQYMALDITARRNLELCQTMRSGEKKGTLLWVLDKTKTPMGGRLIRSWIENPLLSPVAIGKRLNAVEELYENEIERKEIALALGGIGDMERIVARAVYGTANARDLLNLAGALGEIPALIDLLGSPRSAELKNVLSQLDPLEELRDEIERAISADAPLTIREGGIIADGYSPEVDRLRDILSGGEKTMIEIETRERERTGIKKLRVRYNKVFGYYIEISKAENIQPPADYIRRQTVTNAERYINEELKIMEGELLTAQERVKALEYELFTALRQKIADLVETVQRTAAAAARLDVLCSFAQVARDEGYVKPIVDNSDVIRITDGRHPVVEKVLKGSLFVPNDTNMNSSDELVQIITGPNMAGKSTYMRQVALIVLMAHIGSFVSAGGAHIGVVDRIFTRVGASDDLASGQSTFMVEMTEVAQILAEATPRSLLILDEIGRGTSTFDGMAIARAVVEHVASKRKLGAKTLFATHYHELTELESVLAGVKNYNIAVKKRANDVIFLRKIVRGGADDSYGIEVAHLAGLPQSVIDRSREVLKSLESGREVSVKKSAAKAVQSEQLMFIDPATEKIRQKLEHLDVNTLTPIEALTILYEMKKEL